MKSLLQFAAAHGFKVARLTFDKIKTGYAVVYPDLNASISTGRELITIQPVHYSNGDRWLVKQINRPLYYAKNLRQAVKGFGATTQHSSFNNANLFSSPVPFIFNPHEFPRTESKAN